MITSFKNLLFVVTGIVVTILIQAYCLSIVNSDVNRMDVYQMNSWGRMDYGKLYIISRDERQHPQFSLSIHGNASKLDSPAFDSFIVEASSNHLMRVSFIDLPNGQMNVYEGKGYVEESGICPDILLVEGVLTKPGINEDAERGGATERLYVKGMFNKRTFGMSERRWRFVSFLELLQKK